MLTVKTSVRKSDIQGNGLFADEDIKEGSVIWTFVPGFDVVLTQAQVDAFPPQAQEYVERYGYREEGRIILTMDNDRFTNHSPTPNTRVLASGDMVASENIRRDTEITADYLSFDKSWAEKL